ncbi:hypothetical protein [Streptomyces sp. NRRL F-2580]|uniref:hypothetical protein n=1 Tax=Streptomyces sp. NRRL F-2580 TaxID=1463841 RepID=UPI000A6F86C7|nr:hypothetical protein [Streptomyces sp. NRRL F-2580]
MADLLALLGVVEPSGEHFQRVVVHARNNAMPTGGQDGPSWLRLDGFVRPG